MWRGFFVLVAIAASLGFASTVKAADIVSPVPSGGRIRLEARSVVTVRTWLGKLACREGEIYLVEPELRLIETTSPELKVATQNTPLSKAPGALLTRYGEASQVQVIGPYEAGTELIFAIRPTSGECAGNLWYSHDAAHAKLSRDGLATSILWEDSNDNDMNDVHTLVTIEPTKGRELTETTKTSTSVTYKLPWMSGLTRKITTLPGEGYHFGAEIDFALRAGDFVTASAAGTVLWVEDKFAPGRCPEIPNGATESEKKRILELQRYWAKRVNVIVIKTDTDVQTVYLHLLGGSALVKPRDVVKQGQRLAKVGNSGFSCGTHLHFNWQHNCYSLDQALQRRTLKGQRPGEPTSAWSCTKYKPNEAFDFTIAGISRQLSKDAYRSDNQVP